MKQLLTIFLHIGKKGDTVRVAGVPKILFRLKTNYQKGLGEPEEQNQTGDLIIIKAPYQNMLDEISKALLNKTKSEAKSLEGRKPA